MDYNLWALLKMIRQEVICYIGKDKRLFQSGNHAIMNLQEDHRFYSLAEISAKNNHIVLSIQDNTEEMQCRNNEFIDDYIKRFGYEPSFFE